MKYAERFERESVPEWSLHNIDYNTLKHHIKVHTTKDQATAIAIPGHRDTALAKFEEEFYLELRQQHDRVDLFVKSKADELQRRLQYLSRQIHRLSLQSANSLDDHTVLKWQRRFARYGRALASCGDEILALPRFINAQVVAFRKILKKYLKWTGSAALGNRFRDTVLSHPKSFTRQNYSHLRLQYDNLATVLHATTPLSTSPRDTPPERHSEICHGGDQRSAPGSQDGPADSIVDGHEGYWNEYECGSEAGDIHKQMDDSYAIYINPRDDTGFPGMTTLATLFTSPVEKAKSWLARRKSPVAHPGEDGPLLTTPGQAYGSTQSSYLGSTNGELSQTDTEVEPDDSMCETAISRKYNRRLSYPTSDDFPPGYAVHRAAELPSIDEQRLARYRARMLLQATIGAFAVSFVLIGVAGVLIIAGRNRMIAEVDAAVAVGAVASLACACAALTMNVTRPDPLGWPAWLAVWSAFAIVCTLNGVLLVVVASRSNF